MFRTANCQFTRSTSTQSRRCEWALSAPEQGQDQNVLFVLGKAI